MGTIAITGSAGGIGSALRRRLEDDGQRVIGVDVRDAEVIADLATPEGRAAMIDGVSEQSGGRLDGVVAAAGVTHHDGGLVTSINYFGAVATLSGLRPLLSANAGASAVAVSSNSSTTQPGLSLEHVGACLDGDEAAARAVAGHGIAAYGASKLALARWVRQQAITADWAGAGLRLNAVAPGLIATPMTADTEELILGLGEVYPIPFGRAGRPEEVAGLIAYLLSADAAFFCGTVITMDGGTDAALRGTDRPDALPRS